MLHDEGSEFRKGKWFVEDRTFREGRVGNQIHTFWLHILHALCGTFLFPYQYSLIILIPKRPMWAPWKLWIYRKEIYFYISKTDHNAWHTIIITSFPTREQRGQGKDMAMTWSRLKLESWVSHLLVKLKASHLSSLSQQTLPGRNAGENTLRAVVRACNNSWGGHGTQEVLRKRQLWFSGPQILGTSLHPAWWWKRVTQGTKL